MDVFLLWHTYEQADDCGTLDEEKLIGIFSSPEKAQAAIGILGNKEGFRDVPLDCFEVCRMEIDKIHWADGFFTARWTE